MIKEFTIKLLSMLLYAWGAGTISMFVTLSFFVHKYINFSFSSALTTSSISGVMGVVIASPILILFASWFWYVRVKKDFLSWCLVPVVLSLIEVGIGCLLFSSYSAEDVLRFIFIFSFTSFQIALYMWLTFSKFKKSEIDTPIISQHAMEVQNASN